MCFMVIKVQLVDSLKEKRNRMIQSILSQRFHVIQITHRRIFIRSRCRQCIAILMHLLCLTQISNRMNNLNIYLYYTYNTLLGNLTCNFSLDHNPLTNPTYLAPPPLMHLRLSQNNHPNHASYIYINIFMQTYK